MSHQYLESDKKSKKRYGVRTLKKNESPRVRKDREFDTQCREVLKSKSSCKLFLFGTSLVRYLRVEGMKDLIWDRYLFDLHAFNFGVGGDRVEDTLERIILAPLSHDQFRKLEMVFILTGSNDAKIKEPEDIALDIVQCGLKVLSKNPFLKVLISKLLPRKKSLPHQSKSGADENSVISEGNSLLPKYCCDLFCIMDNWDDVDGSYYDSSDGVHLTVKGNRQLAQNIRTKVLDTTINQYITCNFAEAAKDLKEFAHRFEAFVGQNYQLDRVKSVYFSHVIRQINLSQDMLSYAVGRPNGSFVGTASKNKLPHIAAEVVRRCSIANSILEQVLIDGDGLVAAVGHSISVQFERIAYECECIMNCSW